MQSISKYSSDSRMNLIVTVVHVNFSRAAGTVRCHTKLQWLHVSLDKSYCILRISCKLPWRRQKLARALGGDDCPMYIEDGFQCLILYFPGLILFAIFLQKRFTYHVALHPIFCCEHILVHFSFYIQGDDWNSQRVFKDVITAICEQWPRRETWN